jgi:predicted PurR-regulated permease PerM
VIEAIFGVFTVFVITFYWIEERLIIRRLAFAPLKPRQHERAIQIWEDLEAKLGAWVRGQLLMMLTIAIVFGIGLTLLGVKYALPLAIFAGLVEIVPFVGPYAATIPPVLLGLSQSVQLGLVVAAFGLVVQLVEANILMPRVMGRAVGVSHLTVILGLLVGGKLMGLAGAFLAVPIAAAIQVLLVDLEVFGPKEPSRASQPIPDEAPEMPTREEVRPANPPARSSRKQSNRVGEG